MPKAQKKRNLRITKPNLKRTTRKIGRPKGTLKKFLFEETKLGFMLKHEIPVVYTILMNSIPKGEVSSPSPSLIFKVCKASKDPSFKKNKFFRYFEEYKKYGLYCKRGKRLTPERRIYYERLRKKKMKDFIFRNKLNIHVQRIESLKQAFKTTN